MSQKSGHDTFVEEGFNNWEKTTEKLRSHESTGFHKHTLKTYPLNYPATTKKNK